jgi:Erv1 / Alr family
MSDIYNWFFGGAGDVKEIEGPRTWRKIHMFAKRYPDNPEPEHRLMCLSFIRSHVKNFPCAECAENGMDYIIKHPIDTSCKAGLMKWCCDFHNDVNRRTGKRIWKYSEL